MTKIISVEGIDYAGKTTLINSLRPALESEGYEVILLREPGGTPTGDKIRSVILDPLLEMDEHTRLLLFFASRNELIRNKMMPIINKENTIIILDRYIASTFAYSDRINWGFIWSLKTLVAPPDPDMTIYLDLDQETYHERLRESGRAVAEDIIEEKVSKDFMTYKMRFEDYFDRGNTGTLLRLSAKGNTDSNLFKVLTELGKLP